MRNLCTFSFLTVLFLAACGQAPTASTTTTATTPPPAAPTPAPAPAPILATFSDLPPEIDGCSCTFSEAPNEDYKTHIYADNFENTAFLNIDGKMEKFTLARAETMIKSENRMDRIFRNEKYELRVDLEKSGQLDSSTKYKGSFTLTPKGGTAIVKNIVGSCGC